MARAQALVLALTFQFCAPETETPAGKRARSLQAYPASARGARDGSSRVSECRTLGRVLQASVAAVSVVCVQAEVECVPWMRVCWCECRLRGAPGVRWLMFVHAAKWVVYLSFSGLARVASDPVLHLLAFFVFPRRECCLLLVRLKTRVFVYACAARAQWIAPKCGPECVWCVRVCSRGNLVGTCVFELCAHE